MTECNRYEDFYLTMREILRDLIAEKGSEVPDHNRGCCGKYHAGYLAALSRVEAAVRRQAYIFDIPSEGAGLYNVTYPEHGRTVTRVPG